MMRKDRNTKKAKKAQESPIENSNNSTTSTSSINTNSNNTTAASQRERTDIESLRQYILQCPTPSILSTKDCTAVRIAVTALENHLKKMDRDEKLRQKFALQKKVAQQQAELEQEEAAEKDSTGVKSASTHQHVDGMTEEELMEWQDVGQQASSSLGTADSANNLLASSLVDVADEDNDVDIDDDVANVTSMIQTQPSPLGHALSQASIQNMAQNNVCISTPVAAIAVAFHSALRSSILGFVCTGIPEPSNGSGGSGGFAAPVRDLPKGKFLPNKWDQNAKSKISLKNKGHYVALRYRKDGMKTSILQVSTVPPSEDQDDTSEFSFKVKVVFGPNMNSTTNNSDEGEEEPPTCSLTFPLDCHVNLDSLNTALKGGGGEYGVPPALHYKALSSLMTDFGNAADLGAVNGDFDYNGTTNTSDMNMTDDNVKAKSIIPPDYQAKPSSKVMMETTTTTTTTTTTSTYQPPAISTNNYYQGHPTIQDNLLGSRGSSMPANRGDFSDDLLPSGLPLPGFADSAYNNQSRNPNASGNLMGPNHPMFQRTIDDDDDDFNLGGSGIGRGGNNGFPVPGGLGMNPRFDPYYPPGVDGTNGGIPLGPGGRRGVKRGRGRGGRGGNIPYNSRGDPNPDHQRPPSDFGGGGGGSHYL